MDNCCVCSTPLPGPMYRNSKDQPFCWPCADGMPPVTMLDIGDDRRSAKAWLPADDRDVTSGLVVKDDTGKPACVTHGAMNRVDPHRRMYRCQQCGVGAELVIQPVPQPMPRAVHDSHVLNEGAMIVAVEEAAVPAALWVRVGSVWDSGWTGEGAQSSSLRKEPGVWIEWQHEHGNSNYVGPMLLSPSAWRELNAHVEARLRRRQGFLRRYFTGLTGKRR